MNACDVSRLLSHLWRSLDDEIKATYKREEQRLLLEFARTHNDCEEFPRPRRTFDIPQTPFTESSAHTFGPPIDSRPRTVVTRRFDQISANSEGLKT
jgi:hypothetical protein